MALEPVDTADATDSAIVWERPEPASPAGLVLLYSRSFDRLENAYPFPATAVTIGRDGAEIVLPERAVSRRHARVGWAGGLWLIEDLGSRNGTTVRNVPLRGVRALEPGDEVRIGDTLLKFVDRRADRYLAYRIDGHVKGGRRARSARGLVGGYQMDALAAELERLAPTELTCLFLGETGTGKEVAAREVHRLSGRRGPLQAINCAAIPATLIESELFGYRRGAFTGAVRDKPGLVRLADGGTLFLDEIGDMPLEAQAKLLRVLQSREVLPLGATSPERVDVRILAATHFDLRARVREGNFRGDLAARLSEHVATLPPLRARKEDVFQLTRLFCARYGAEGKSISFRFLAALLHYDWPFNVRELESCIKRASALCDADELDLSHLPDPIRACVRFEGASLPAAPLPSQPVPFAGELDSPSDARPSAAASLDLSTGGGGNAAPMPEESELRRLLASHRGNVAAVGRCFGKERMQVHRWMKRYGIRADDYRQDS
jgi:transcriptional regulator with GAF, ATPase, and Fis domain